MKTRRYTADGYQFISSFDKFIKPLCLEGKIENPDRESFIRDYLGLHHRSWHHFNKSGIRLIYKRVYELLCKAYPEAIDKDKY